MHFKVAVRNFHAQMRPYTSSRFCTYPPSKPKEKLP